MSSTGVLPFVRGVDFTRNDFSVSTTYKTINNFSIIDNFHFVYRKINFPTQLAA